ncbi:MAG TPA: aspartyl/asparaginyl beta-hydroxylase domain-containing protein [Kofleriaceae bacterium]|nr:aspartyl/asparaginyl beta-hydroxylase domain-containing protein [Kofleriaceae bacterium]
MTQAYYPLEDFPLIEALAGKWLTIREEFLALDAPVTPLHRFGKTYREVGQEVQAYMAAGGEYGWMAGWGLHGANPAWLQYPLIAFDSPSPFVMDTMPLTLELMRDIPAIKTCALVKLKAGGALPVHQHPEFREHGLLLLHLTLDAAAEKNYAYLNVDGEWRQHAVGSAIVFDGACDHFVVNESAADRTILYLEFGKEELMRRRDRQ